MKPFGTPHRGSAIRAMLLGSGELGKEVAIELQRLAVEVIAVDRYANAPAMQVAHRSHVINMLDGAEIRRLVALEQPDLIVPEIEAIDTATLIELEREGVNVIPTARAAWLTMNREGIRRLAAEELGLPTSAYRFVDSEAEYRAAVGDLGLPFVIKPVMSSSGKGQSTGPQRSRHGRGLGLRAIGRTRRAGSLHRRGLRRFRLRDHPADRSPRAAARASARRSAIARKRATIANPGSRSR